MCVCVFVCLDKKEAFAKENSTPPSVKVEVDSEQKTGRNRTQRKREHGISGGLKFIGVYIHTIGELGSDLSAVECYYY